MPGAYESIASVTLTSGTTTITFSSIPSTYQHLQIRMYTRSTVNNGDTDFTYFIFNSTFGTAYQYCKMGAIGTDPGYLSKDGATAYFVTERTPSAIVTADVYQVGYMDIMDYAVANKKRTVQWFTGFTAGTTANNSNMWTEMGVGLWNNTAAVSSITAGLAYGVNFTVGTSISLYGIKSS